MDKGVLSEMKERLSYPLGVLLLLQETRLFGPEIERAIVELRDALEELEQIKEARAE